MTYIPKETGMRPWLLILTLFAVGMLLVGAAFAEFVCVNGFPFPAQDFHLLTQEQIDAFYGPSPPLATVLHGAGLICIGVAVIGGLLRIGVLLVSQVAVVKR